MRAYIPEVQVLRVLETGVDELFDLAVDPGNQLGERQLLGERSLGTQAWKNKGQDTVVSSETAV